jgi:hypothetical protein
MPKIQVGSFCNSVRGKKADDNFASVFQQKASFEAFLVLFLTL